MAKKKNPGVHLKQSDVKRIKREAADSALNYAVILLLAVMHDKCGYRRKRLKRLYSQIVALSDSIAEGYVNLHELKDMLSKEAKLTIDLRGKY